MVYIVRNNLTCCSGKILMTCFVVLGWNLIYRIVSRFNFKAQIWGESLFSLISFFQHWLLCRNPFSFLIVHNMVCYKNLTHMTLKRAIEIQYYVLFGLILLFTGIFHPSPQEENGHLNALNDFVFKHLKKWTLNINMM